MFAELLLGREALSHVQSFTQQSPRETEERRQVGLDVLVGFAEKNFSLSFIYVKPQIGNTHCSQVTWPHFKEGAIRVDSRQRPRLKGRLRATESKATKVIVSAHTKGKFTLFSDSY